ncbi:MAG: aldo/keto reductase [Chloroflexi bacterium]|nr:MAG: aldo/keto reductase [Chloroflexota bacterium]
MDYGKVIGIDKPISRLVQGTVMLQTSQMAEGFELLDAIFEAGGTAFDTAHGYGNGESDRTLGAWINSRGNRDRVVILGKGAHHNRDRQRVTPYDISSDLHDSLARMKLDFIDLYVLHRDDPSQPVGPIVEVLNEHHKAGKIGSFGGSNWTPARIAEANAYAAANGLLPFVVSSPNFSMAVQKESPWENCLSIAGPEAAADRAWYKEQKMPLFVWSSLAGGFLTGRFRRDNLDTFSGYNDELVVRCYCTEENFGRIDRAEEIAKEKGLTLPQISLSYVLHSGLDVYALVGTRTGGEFRENVYASQVKLSADEVAYINGVK